MLLECQVPFHGRMAHSVPEADCLPEHGRTGDGRRQLPLLVKDVAGLVPGAYLGRGRGNAFLNDLCDADSLVHVVDASGRSDAEGVEGGSMASEPLEEVGWVKREIHMWIFSNVRAKWDTVRRKAQMAKQSLQLHGLAAERLFGLFTGYHASQQLVAQVYEATGHHVANLPQAWRASEWSRTAHLHGFSQVFHRSSSIFRRLSGGF